MHQMQAAPKAGEGDRLAGHVDFPAVREGLKSRMQAFMVEALQSDSMKDNPFAAFGMALAGGMVNTLADGMVTSERAANVVNNGNRVMGLPVLLACLGMRVTGGMTSLERTLLRWQ